MIGLSRNQILAGDFTFPQELVKLIPTKHFISRLEQRGIGLDCIPTLVRVSKSNIHSGRTEDGKELVSVVVRLNYTSSKFIFLAFNPKDGAIKTMWFREKGNNGRKVADKDSGQAVRDAESGAESEGHS